LKRYRHVFAIFSNLGKDRFAAAILCCGAKPPPELKYIGVEGGDEPPRPDAMENGKILKGLARQCRAAPRRQANDTYLSSAPVIRNL
jgi:hypothetical protein